MSGVLSACKLNRFGLIGLAMSNDLVPNNKYDCLWFRV